MKELEYFIDTSVFMRVLTRDDAQKFQDCVRFLEKVKTGRVKAATATLVLAEVQWTLARHYQFPKIKILKGLRLILQLKNLRFSDEFHISTAIEMYESHSVKFTDVLIVSHVLIHQGKATVVSYDKDFDTLGILRKEPEEIR